MAALHRGPGTVVVLFSDIVSAHVRVAECVGPGGPFRARASAGGRIALLLFTLGAAAGCDVNTALEHQAEARRLAASVLIEFTKAADASNRAVMADTDEASVAFAREAEQATQAAQKNTDALGPRLRDLGYSDESRLLEQFVTRFAEYRAMDRRILDFAVENTNLKAQRLSFGPAQEAADTFRDSLAAVVPSVPAKDKWQAEALVARAVETVREIQVLQAPHIADADDAVMTRMEQRMGTSEAAARSAVETLAPPRPARVPATAGRGYSRPGRSSWTSTRRSSPSPAATRNVRSLALALDQKRTLTAACSESLHALQDALAKRGFTGTR